MTDYTTNPEVNKLLNDIEVQFTQMVGRSNAQRMIGIFSNYNEVGGLVKGLKEPRNIWDEIFELGKKAKI
jgi:hypothetical protein